jgi:hypothetical protein
VQDALLTEIEIRNPRSSNGQPLELCEAWFFVGAKAHVDGDDELARWAFQKALATRAIDTPLYASARVDLADLER